MRFIQLCIMTILLAGARLEAAVYYASPSGLPSNAGTIGSPWNLRVALCGGRGDSIWCGGNRPPVMAAGDTLYLRGGVYAGIFDSRLRGMPGTFITVQSAPGEWAIIDGYATSALTVAVDLTVKAFRLADPSRYVSGMVLHIENEQVQVQSGAGNVLTVVRGWNGTKAAFHPAGALVFPSSSILEDHAAFTIYRDFEIRDSNPNRVFGAGGDASNQRSGSGIFSYGTSTKFINLVIHDTQDAVFSSDTATGTEAHGLLLFNNGHVDADRGHGNGLYIQNQNGTKRFTDVISFNNFAGGMKAFGETGYANNVEFIGVISFNNSSPASYPGNPAKLPNVFRDTNLFVGTGNHPARNVVISNNYLYDAAGTHVGTGVLGLGYVSNGNSTNWKVTDNYIVGGTPVVHIDKLESSVITGNTMVGRPTPAEPTGMKIYEASFASKTMSNKIDNNTYYDLNGTGGQFRTSYNLSAADIANCCKNRLGSGLLEFNNIETNKSGITNTSPSVGEGSGWVQWTGFDLHSKYIEGSLPKANVVAVRPNAYEPGRCNVAVFNWENAAEVKVNLSGCGLNENDSFAVWDVQNWRDWSETTAVQTGTYRTASPSITIRTSSLSTVVTPIGHKFTPAHTAPEFAAFIIRKIAR